MNDTQFVSLSISTTLIQQDWARLDTNSFPCIDDNSKMEIYYDGLLLCFLLCCTHLFVKRSIGDLQTCDTGNSNIEYGK